jgi:predicted NAD-dependent protein-ADP-ribosyltransferase YbiA (DUF1768 family)
MKAIKPKMDKFKPGVLELVAETECNGFRIRQSKEDESMVAFVFDDVNKEVLVLFSRAWFSNMAGTDILLVDEGGVEVRMSCTEQLFTAYKACFAMETSSNFEESMMGIYSAEKPLFAKKFGSKINGLDSKKWNENSMIRMFCCILFGCKTRSMFDRLHSCLEVIGDGYKFKIVEANYDDMLWGVRGFTPDVIKAIITKKEEQPTLGLFEIFEAFKKDNGENRLGDLLTDFIEATKGVSHEEYLKAVEGIEFVEIIEPERTGSDEFEMERTGSDEFEMGRTCSEPASERTCSEPAAKRTCSGFD